MFKRADFWTIPDYTKNSFIHEGIGYLISNKFDIESKITALEQCAVTLR